MPRYRPTKRLARKDDLDLTPAERALHTAFAELFPLAPIETLPTHPDQIVNFARARIRAELLSNFSFREEQLRTQLRRATPHTNSVITMLRLCIDELLELREQRDNWQAQTYTGYGDEFIHKGPLAPNQIPDPNHSL